ncbi:MAG: hypothetical protein CMJ17_09850 [Phenylobacterium sp.]|nr:hypothetical protein [Phenylobacterium sp.]
MVEEEVLIEVFPLVILQEQLVVQVAEVDNVNLVVLVILLHKLLHKETQEEQLHLQLVAEVVVLEVLDFQEMILVMNQKQAQLLLYNLI